MKKWIRSKLWIYFSFLVFVISAVIIILTILVFSLLNYFELFGIFSNLSNAKWIIPLSFIGLMGIIISAVVSKYILMPITQLQEAMDKVIESDFSVQLNEDQIVLEVESLFRAFNIMVKELNGIERFQNDFTSIVSHEFKTPLATIQGYVQLLQSPEITDVERNNYYHKILHATRQLSTMTNNILKLTKLDNQSISIEFKSYRLDEQIRQSILFLQPKWEEKDIQLVIDLDTVDYNGNEALLEQVWINLIANAIQYNRPHGQIIIKLNLHIDLISILIEDTGVGIQEDKLPHIFERFYQVERSRFNSGNGLGLTIVKSIIELHHGEITYTSTYGQGTIVNIILPNKKKTLPSTQ